MRGPERRYGPSGDRIVVECYCFLIKIIVVGVEPRRDALVYAPCVFCLKILIGLAKRLDLPNVARCCCSPFPVKVALFDLFGCI